MLTKSQALQQLLHRIDGSTEEVVDNATSVRFNSATTSMENVITRVSVGSYDMFNNGGYTDLNLSYNAAGKLATASINWSEGDRYDSSGYAIVRIYTSPGALLDSSVINVHFNNGTEATSLKLNRDGSDLFYYAVGPSFAWTEVVELYGWINPVSQGV